jgi:hypothetical protein
MSARALKPSKPIAKDSEEAKILDGVRRVWLSVQQASTLNSTIRKGAGTRLAGIKRKGE